MSLDTNAIDFIESLVLRYMSSSQSFTSVDIANRAKEEGYYARNRWVAEWLRSNAIPLAHEFGHLYNQTLIRVQSKADGSTLAYLYHHMHANPDDYLDRDQNPKSYQAPGQKNAGYHPIPVPPKGGHFPGSRSTTGGQHHSNQQWRDSRGRFIPM